MYSREKKSILFSGTPRCASKEIYTEWRKAAYKSRPGEAGFCTDCTPEYQTQMIAENRCEHPWIEFDYREDDTPPPSKLTEQGKVIFALSDKGVVGYVPQSIKKGKYDKAKEGKEAARGHPDKGDSQGLSDHIVISQS